MIHRGETVQRFAGALAGIALVVSGCASASPSVTASIGAGGTPERTATPQVSSPPEPTPAPGTWKATGDMIEGRYDHTATLLLDGTVLIVGGGSGCCAGPPVVLASAERYDPDTESWSATGSMTAPRNGHTATLLLDGTVLVAGGGNWGGGANGQTLASAEVYDPRRGIWTAMGDMIDFRIGHTATLLRDGRVLVAGGQNDTAELYDPDSGTWTGTGNMVEHRSGHTATLLPDGRVLVAGDGSNSRVFDNAGDSAELYDSDSGSWNATGNMDEARAAHTATLLADGKVLVAGDSNGGLPASAELYDPNSGSWTENRNMVGVHAQHTATLLPNGRVLVAGGGIYNSGGYLDLASVEVYDPSSGTWAAVGSMVTPRAGHTATLLLDGRVLVAGGFRELNPVGLASAELYDPGSAS